MEPAPLNPRSKTLSLSLWKISHSPLRSSLRSLSVESTSKIDELENFSVLALFSLVDEDKCLSSTVDFNLDVDGFRRSFKADGFLHPQTLASGRGFCFFLEGNKSSALAYARCISFVQVVSSRPLCPGKFLHVGKVFDLFPAATQFSLRFPMDVPPFSKTSFVRSRSMERIVSTKKELPVLNWRKEDKLERWRDHISEIVPGIYVGGERVAMNGDLLRRNGITHIVNSCEQICKSAEGFEKLAFKMNDGGNESILSVIWRTTVFIDEALENGAVLVHCQEGVSRSISIVIGYLILREGYDYTGAFNLVRLKRRVASPHPRFIAQLIQLAEICGVSSKKTCFYSKQKQIPFKISERNDEFLPVPLSDRIKEKDEGVFVVIDFPNSENIGLNKDGEEGTVRICSSENKTDEEYSCARQLVSDLVKCVRIQFTEDE